MALSQYCDDTTHCCQASTDEKASEQNWFGADETRPSTAPSRPFRIMCIAAAPAIRIQAQRKLLKPGIDPVMRLTARPKNARGSPRPRLARRRKSTCR
jgi:hypothetical protein